MPPSGPLTGPGGGVVIMTSQLPLFTTNCHRFRNRYCYAIAMCHSVLAVLIETRTTCLPVHELARVAVFPFVLQSSKGNAVSVLNQTATIRYALRKVCCPPPSVVQGIGLFQYTILPSFATVMYHDPQAIRLHPPMLFDSTRHPDELVHHLHQEEDAINLLRINFDRLVAESALRGHSVNQNSRCPGK